MKKIITILAAVILTANVFAQAPQMMTYQSVVRNTNGALVTNTSIGVKISILQDSATGTAVYQEIFNPNPHTNANGLVSIAIGGGIPVLGTFSAINWGTGSYYIETQTDPTGGTNYTISGTSQLLSVPYALYAKTTSNNGFSNMQVFNSSGSSNFTVPASVTKIMVEVWGAGGGGGIVNTGNDIGGGGGGGGYGKDIFSVTPDSSYTVTVGTGGGGGSSSVGDSGSASSFGGLISATGGAGGLANAAGGAGGTSTARYNIAGGAGWNGGSGGGGLYVVPNGGNAGLGGQGGRAGGGGGSGYNGASPGGGGGGSMEGSNGGNGANGRVVVWW